MCERVRVRVCERVLLRVCRCTRRGRQSDSDRDATVVIIFVDGTRSGFGRNKTFSLIFFNLRFSHGFLDGRDVPDSLLSPAAESRVKSRYTYSLLWNLIVSESFSAATLWIHDGGGSGYLPSTSKRKFAAPRFFFFLPTKRIIHQRLPSIKYRCLETSKTLLVLRKKY